MRSAVCRLCAVFLALAMLASAAGCAGSASGTRFYVLTPIAADPAPARAMDVAVVVAGVRLPQYLERPQIVTRSGDNRLQFAEFDQWGGNLHQDMTRVLAESLTRLLGSERVVAAPHTLRMQPDYRVEVEVLGFERGPDGRVHLATKWWLMRSGDATPLAGPGADLYGAALPDAEAYDAVVASMSQVYGEFARLVAQAIRQRAAARP